MHILIAGGSRELGAATAHLDGKRGWSVCNAAEDAFGKVTGFVNNADIVAPGSQVADLSIERMERMFRINVTGAFPGAREVARRMPLSR